MSERKTIAWAGSQSGSRPAPWSVGATRRDAIKEIVKGAIGASDYNRLDDEGRWKLARKYGWTVVKVEIVEASHD
jgi:hypothetical protein